MEISYNAVFLRLSSDWCYELREKKEHKNMSSYIRKLHIIRNSATKHLTMEAIDVSGLLWKTRYYKKNVMIFVEMIENKKKKKRDGSWFYCSVGGKR